MVVQLTENLSCLLINMASVVSISLSWDKVKEVKVLRSGYKNLTFYPCDPEG